jgi:hypothetical protein
LKIVVERAILTVLDDYRATGRDYLAVPAHAVVIKPRIYKSNIDARGGIKLINPGEFVHRP